MGFTTKEDFIRDVIRFRCEWHSGKYEYVEIPKERYEELDGAVRKMNTPYRGADEFINAQVEEVLEKYEEWKKQKR